MKARITVLFSVIFSLFSNPVFSQDEPFKFRVVTTGLMFPWEITYGPDGFIWVTERNAKRVTRVDPITGIKTVAVTISDIYQSGGDEGLRGDEGLKGMALHPQLLQGTGKDFVYLASVLSHMVTA